MKRAFTTITAALLLMACEGDPKGPGGQTAGINTDTDSSSEGTEGASVTGSAETDPPPPATTANETETGAVTEGDPGTDTEATTCNFVCDTTSGTDTSYQCDNWSQDCPNGQKCAAYADDGGTSWNSLKCVPVEENGGAPGDPCTVEGSGVSGIDSCAFGSMCWDVDTDTGQGTCVALCTGSPDAANCADSNTTCVIANDGVLNLCLPKCDPLLQDCDGDDLCLQSPFDANAFVCILDASGENGVAFDPCEYANACDKGFVCQDPGYAMECDPQALGCCLPYCDITAPDCPGAGQDCIPWYEPGTAPPNYENVGLCGIPMG